MKIFTENKHKIASHNKGFSSGHHTYKLRMNKYGDMLHHEFVATMNGFRGNSTGGFKANRQYQGASFIEPNDDVVMPKNVDWRTKGAVTPVKDQKQCGSCWAFSATGSLEGQTFLKTGKLPSLSEQNLVDCSEKFGNMGCFGGLMDSAFKYIKANGGIDTEASYPYEAKNGHCRYNATNVGGEDTGFVDIHHGNEKALMEAVAKKGPISVAIDASRPTFHFYHEGVYYDEKCSSMHLDHGVLAVGYGSDKKGGDYWLVKNSWNTSWGNKGYIQMARNKKNACGIATQASYPLVQVAPLHKHSHVDFIN